MCGRYTYTQVPDPETIVQPEGVQLTLQPRYNIAPSQYAPVVPQQDPQQIYYFRWGLIPHWAKDARIGYKMINARSETVLEKASFKGPVRHARCVVLADSFYEWKKRNGGKQPIRIGLQGFEPFVMAGISSRWTSPEGRLVESYSILTTEPNALMADIHDRMPVLLTREAGRRWLNPREPVEDLVAELCRPFPAEAMVAYPVSAVVGNVRNDDVSLIEPLD